MLARVRKAVMAGVMAGAGAGVALLLKDLDGGLTSAEVGQVLGAALAVALPAAVATWRIPNAMPAVPRQR